MKFEPKVTNITNHFIDLNKIGEKSIIVDAGACWGSFIHAFRKFNEKARIIAIEPCRNNIKKLREKEFRNIELYEKALVGMNASDKIVFTEVPSRKKSGTILGIKYKDKNKAVETKDYEVETIKINNIFKILGIDSIDFLKMDIEGAEVEILKTMSQEVASKIKQISVEIHIGLTGISINATIEILEKLGYIAWQARRLEVYARRG